MSVFRREVGMTTRSCSALLALRIRVSMSATGSVSIFRTPRLPAALGHAWDRALVRELAQADPAQAELLEHGTRPPAAVAARVVAHLEPLRLPLLVDERFLRHLVLTVPFCRRRSRTGNRARAAKRGRGRRSRRWS